jgi:hypothetical protein
VRKEDGEVRKGREREEKREKKREESIFAHIF